MASISFDEMKQSNSFAEVWDSFVDSSINGTIFHKVAFLSYHDIEHQSKLKYFEFKLKNKVIARLAFGLDGSSLHSPYGASYGGFIFNDYLSYSVSIHLVDCLLEIARIYKVEKIFYTPPIQAAHDSSFDTFNFALFEKGFRLDSADITNVFDRKYSQFSNRLLRARQRAMAQNVMLNKNGSLEDFWCVLQKTYAKHGANPTHSFMQLRYLIEKDGLDIRMPVAYFNDLPVAALGCFKISKHLDSSFYICSDPLYKDTQALSYLLSETLNTVDERIRYFSFGTSSVSMMPRLNIFEFKENFTRIGMFKLNFIKELV